MRGLVCRVVEACCLALLVPSVLSHAQQAPDSFHWVDFHADKDQSVVAWVTRSLAPEHWTAIREIGVEYDSALVVTTLRTNPQGAATGDPFTVWSASLTTHQVVRLLQGSQLHLADWLQLLPGHPRELAALYDDCSDCNPSTFFTVFYYDITQHGWAARWLHSNQAVSIRNANPPQGVQWTQVFAVLANANGDELAGSWTHIDHGAGQPPEDFLYQYDVDPWTGLDRVQPVAEKQILAMKQRLCSAQDAVPGLARGQDSELCGILLHPEQVQQIQKPCKCEGQPESNRRKK